MPESNSLFIEFFGDRQWALFNAAIVRTVKRGRVDQWGVVTQVAHFCHN